MTKPTGNKVVKLARKKCVNYEPVGGLLVVVWMEGRGGGGGGGESFNFAARN